MTLDAEDAPAHLSPKQRASITGALKPMLTTGAAARKAANVTGRIYRGASSTFRG